jgi:WD40 repeat-containing protein SMU1
MRTADPLITLRNFQPERWLKLDHFAKRSFFNPSEAYDMGSSKELRRQEIADSLACEVSVVEPSRLLSLLGLGLRYQQSQGTLPQSVSFDLFKGSKKSAKKDIEEREPKIVVGDVVFPNKTRADVVQFSPDGLNLVCGGVDGKVALWDSETTNLRQDLEYQQKGEFMSHEGSCVLCVVFSKDGEHMATGSQNGAIKIWKIATGACLRKFSNAHPLGITSLSFSRDGTQLLSSSYDQTARIHGLKSGKSLKEFR